VIKVRYTKTERNRPYENESQGIIKNDFLVFSKVISPHLILFARLDGQIIPC